MKESLHLSVKRFFLERWRSKIIGGITGSIILFQIARDWVLANEHTIKELITILSTFILIELLADYIEIIVRISKIKKKHFPLSFPIVNNKILKAFHEKAKTKDSGHIEDNKRLDRIIKPPVEYTKEVLTGNTTPPFKPNASYLEEIYDNDISHIVAISAENPNLWLDSTLSFYMLNCCAVSLIRKKNENINKTKIVIKDLEDNTIYQKFKTKSKKTLQELSNGNKTSTFEFVRFILFNNQHYECLKDSVFPSLKAAQDLFKIKSYFINYENLKMNISKNKYSYYSKNIKDLWDIISTRKTKSKELKNDMETFLKIIKNRKVNDMPEFLILFKNNDDIILHTYVAGYDERIKFSKSDKNYQNVKLHISSIISFLAEYRLSNGMDDWNPNEDNFNSKKSYIDWE